MAACSPAVEVLPHGPAIRLLRSGDLFARSREILIEHSGAYYRLRLTQSNKLILTK
ncbi:MAG: hemin uptake protein HemP [Steroidobacter sp.]